MPVGESRYFERQSRRGLARAVCGVFVALSGGVGGMERERSLLQALGGFLALFLVIGVLWIIWGTG